MKKLRGIIIRFTSGMLSIALLVGVAVANSSGSFFYYQPKETEEIHEYLKKNINNYD